MASEEVAAVEPEGCPPTERWRFWRLRSSSHPRPGLASTPTSPPRPVIGHESALRSPTLDGFDCATIPGRREKIVGTGTKSPCLNNLNYISKRVYFKNINLQSPLRAGTISHLTTEPHPAQPRPPSGRPVATWTLYVFVAILLAFGGGMLATVAYDRFVTTPTSGDLLPVSSPPPRPVESSDAGLSVEPPLDPVAQRAADVRAAIQTVQASLPPYAQAEVEIRVDEDVVFVSGQVDTRSTLATVAHAAAMVEGIRAVDSRQIEIASRTHLVEAGDTLSEIAELYYGESRQWGRLTRANPGLQASGLTVGIEIVVPPPSADDDTVAAQAPTVRQAPIPRPGGPHHVVGPGETLSTISRLHYGRQAMWRKIAEANPTIDARSLRPGTVLVIPAPDE